MFGNSSFTVKMKHRPPLIGHIRTPPFGVHSPNIQTSLAEVNRRKLIDSGAIHLMGNFPLEATGKARQAVYSSD